jgi:UDP-N-acetyl-D-mannosaminuronic acid transferase (WecB/TagA/CpsF family)
MPLGLAFYSGSPAQAAASAKGLCVFPSAPGLSALDKDPRYRAALLKADMRFVDSGFLALFWFFLTGERLQRVSGLRFLKTFLADPALRQKRILWIHPSAAAQNKNHPYLEEAQKLPPALSSHYVAPFYPADSPIADAALLDLCRQTQPEIIVINLGSGTQEPLGAYLKENLRTKDVRGAAQAGYGAAVPNIKPLPEGGVGGGRKSTPLILCTGGAIEFLTGAQAFIPDWADRLFLGWLFRIFATPHRQAKTMRTSPVFRYIGAWRLLWLLLKYRRRLPQ